MRSPRLFAKILLGFWLTLFVMGVGMGLLFSAQRRVSRDAAQATMHAAAPRSEPVDGAPLGPPPPADIGDGDGGIPVIVQISIISAVSGLIFSIALARYITAPITLLHSAFQRLAEGDLGVRLHDATGARRDEVADLGHEFDRMADRLVQLIDAREQFLHDVSHELRSPLSRLQVAIGLARQQPSRRETSLDRIELEAGRLDALVGQLLALARAEGGDTALDYFDPVMIAERVIDDARFEAQAKGVAITLALPDTAGTEEPVMCGDAELIRRALDNVVRNALRHARALIAVTVSLREGAYTIVVIDDGPGVGHRPPESLFEPFVRGDGGGAGLGLAIARRAVAAHRGRISAANRAEGGFGVRIDLPAAGSAVPAGM